MKNIDLEMRLLRSAHIYAEKVAWPDESAVALLRNRDTYIAQSKAIRNKLPAHPAVPTCKSLVVVDGPSNDSFLPVIDYDQDLIDGFDLKYGRA